MRLGWICACVCACGGAPVEPTPVPPPPRAPELACVLAGPWEPRQPHDLALRPGGHAFARFSHVDHVKLRLGAAAVLEVSWKELTASGVVDRDALLFHPTRALVLGGYIAPGPNAVLRWRGAHVFALEVPAELKPAAPVREELACDAVSLAVASFTARDAVAGKTLRKAMLPGDTAIALATTPGGPAVAELHYGAADEPTVDVLEERAGQARVAVLPHSLDPDRDLIVFGWVASSLLFDRPHGYGGSWATGGDPGLMHERNRKPLRHVTCAHDVELVGDLDGEQHPFGTLHPGVGIDVLSADGELAQIVVRELPLQILPDGRLFAPTASLADCTE
jgi:hypothetical protein